MAKQMTEEEYQIAKKAWLKFAKIVVPFLLFLAFISVSIFIYLLIYGNH